MKKKFLSVLMVALSTLTLASCNDNPQPDPDAGLTGTALAVSKASKMTIEELEAASKAEMEASDDTFKVLGLTSVLSKAVTALCKKYDWLKEDVKDGETVTQKGNTYCNNSYKDYTLLTALEPAADSYVADFALVQDERSIADYADEGILHNYVPSDYASFGLAEEDTAPLKGLHFNKIFWTNTNFQNVTGKTLYNIWQMAGTSADPDHLAKVSFQSPVTEQVNMSFLLSCLAPSAQERIEKAYKDYYGRAWEAGKYTSAGEQWVTEFINTVNTTGRWHSSDGTAMKETQLKDDWAEGYVYYGAYAKMKDAAGKYYAITGQAEDAILAPLVEPADSKNAGKINAMKTVKWDWEINGFNGYFYTMDSQIVNNAKHPYTACLFARYLLDPDFYAATIYNSSTPNKDGSKGNQYGYYYPGESEKVSSNDNDWTKAKWKECSLVENFEYLGSVKSAKVAYVSSLIK